MIAIDTNVLIALMSSDPATNNPAQAHLQKISAIESLCICGAVFSELLGLPGRDEKQLLQLIDSIRIAIEWETAEADWIAAGVAYQGYVARRRASAGGLPRRIATDFIIGAHASVRGYSLLTADQRLYNAAFPTLYILNF